MLWREPPGAAWVPGRARSAPQRCDPCRDICGLKRAQSASCCYGAGTLIVCAQGPRRRVWWAPTTDKERSDFGGMFWTATVMKKTKTSYKVVYDNGARRSAFPLPWRAMQAL